MARSKARFTPGQNEKRPMYVHRGQTRCPAPYVKKLSFGELEPLARTLLTILLALVRARVAGQKPQLLQPGPQLRIELHQSPGNAEASRAGLSVNAAAISENTETK